MKKTSKATKTSGNKSIIFFGTGPVAAASLAFLVDYFPIEAVITKAVPTYHKEVAPVEQIAKAAGLKVLLANQKAELDELMKFRDFRSRLGVIVDYGVIVSAETIAAFKLGIVNSHFSLLPEWRGADPITFSILSGQPKTGVSLMIIEPELDTGKLLVQKSLPIQPDDTTSTLTQRLIKLSNQLLAEYLPLYISGEIKPRSQPHPDRATYSRKLTKDDGLIDWKKSAEQIEREIRAFAEWPKSRTTIAGKEVIITKARVDHSIEHRAKSKESGKIIIQDKQLAVQTGDGLLVIEKLKPAGKNEMTAKAFLAGYRLWLMT